ncbi:MAG: hypothetical protein KC731_41045 [Myxococcales bacterium]|nr:hypothetical protein [Myxococcales bacterium]
MPYVQLHAVLPELAEAETRSMTTFEAGEPTGTYHLVEMFCDEPGCDCRRAFIQVFSEDPSVVQPRATITWGWESDEFYRRWAGFPLEEGDLEELRGPALARMSRQSEEAEELLERFRAVIGDEAYAARIVRHYEAFRATVPSRPSPLEARRPPPEAIAKRRAKNKQRRKTRAKQRKRR